MLKLPCFGQLMWRADSLEKNLMLGKIEGRRRRGRQRTRWLVEWYHRLSEHEFEQTPGDSEGQRSLVCCSPRDHKESWLSDWTTITRFTFASCHWQLPVCSQHLWECLCLISHKGDQTVFVFIWLLSPSIVPFRSIHAVPSPRNSFLPSFIYLSGHSGSLLLHTGFLWLQQVAGYSSLWCGGFSSLWLLMLRAVALGVWALVDVACGLSSCDAWAYLPWNMWDLPRPGIELVSPTFTGGLLTTESPRRAQVPGFLWLSNIPHILHLLYIRIHWWILRLFPYFGYCK